MKASVYIYRIETAAGALVLGSYKKKICLCDWDIEKGLKRSKKRLQESLAAEIVEKETPLIKRAKKQLQGYLSGKRKQFNLPLLLLGTDFQKRVWDVLLTIPYGKTLSYKRVAEKAGHPSAVRAVANAVGANPLSILVPCHRVIGSNLDLVGYAGGLKTKKMLLELEDAPNQSFLNSFLPE